MQNKSIIVALDTITLNETSSIITELDPSKCMVKVGSVLFNSEGRAALDLVANAGFEIFLILNFMTFQILLKVPLNHLMVFLLSFLQCIFPEVKACLVLQKKQLSLSMPAVLE